MPRHIPVHPDSVAFVPLPGFFFFLILGGAESNVKDWSHGYSLIVLTVIKVLKLTFGFIIDVMALSF